MPVRRAAAEAVAADARGFSRRLLLCFLGFFLLLELFGTVEMAKLYMSSPPPPCMFAASETGAAVGTLACEWAHNCCGLASVSICSTRRLSKLEVEITKGVIFIVERSQVKRHACCCVCCGTHANRRCRRVTTMHTHTHTLSSAWSRWVSFVLALSPFHSHTHYTVYCYKQSQYLACCACVLQTQSLLVQVTAAS